MSITEREKELLGNIEGLVNWASALQTLIENTDCNPDNEEEFNEIVLCCNLQISAGESVLSKYGFRK